MSEQPREHPPEFGQDWRQRLLKSSLTLPAGRVRTTKKAASTRTITAAPVAPQPTHSAAQNISPSRERCTNNCWTNSTGETCWERARKH